jgi:hypothetical protein
MFILLVSSIMTMPKNSEVEEKKKREKIQIHFWNIVGAVEHINVPKIEDAIRKEFKTDDDRFIQTQINLMQTETKIRVQRKNKVWIRQPQTDIERK